MNDSRLLLHAGSLASAILGAAICMAIFQLIGLSMGWDVTDVLLYGLSR